jgi:putative FmdB family regulatory protein
MTYEYQCGACSHRWEAEQSISEPPLTTCPNCKAEAAKRLVTGGQGFILKGGGWYADGYGPAKKGDSSAAKETAAPAGAAPKETKSEAAPAPAATSTTDATGTKA